ncbi:uncharacterized protein VTP21DRAFT_9180 [Calcarisporiella thermophila]|uniref:uncharacterized protein n=1 Tax=Calcarisporiella thermophila TaxID=911321 RepID=UPI0037436414
MLNDGSILLSHLQKYGLDLVPHSTKIRAVTAKRTFHPGSEIARWLPLAVVPLPDHAQKLCHQCLETAKSRCSRCKKAWFCGTACFQNAWSEWHKVTCGADVKLDAEGLMLLKVTIALKGQKGAVGEAFLSLPTHINELSAQVIARFRQIAAQVHGLIPEVDVEILLSYLCRFRCNNFSVVDAQLFPVAEGTYPFGSLLNHACRPNAVALYDGNTQVIRVLEKIEVGEEVSVAYMDVIHGKLARQAALRETYAFNCQCTRCLGDDWVDSLLEIDGRKTGIEVEEDLTKCEVNSPSIASTFASTVITTYLNSRSDRLKANELPQDILILPYSLVDAVSHANARFQKCITYGHWEGAGHLGRFILAVYLLAYPRNHPMTGLHAFSLGKCLWNCSNLAATQEAIKFLSLATTVLELNLRGNRTGEKVVNEAKALLHEAQKECRRMS